MAQFVDANRKRQLDEHRMLAEVGYVAGIIGSMALAKRRPSFKEVFDFPEPEHPVEDPEAYKQKMLAWAEQVNRADRKSRKGGK